VRCVNSAGGPTDSRFTLTYVNQTSIVGSAPYLPGSAYARADQPAAPSYTPGYQFNSTRASTPITITRLDVGKYTLSVPSQDLSSGDVQVTAYGGSGEFCRVAKWNAADGIVVQCFSKDGSPSDTKFDAALLVAYLIF
jgi:hypothetical protein